MNFYEFLLAMNDDMVIEIFESAVKGEIISNVAHKRLWEYLKEYLITGGMPRVVASYITLRKDFYHAANEARKIQKGIIEAYFKDFAKHSGKTNAMHIISVFENIPSQLARNMEGSVKRYRFKDVIPNKKSYAELEGPIQWLVQAGLAIKIKICNRAEIPLESFTKPNHFKLFLFDIGLLGQMLELSPGAIIDQKYGITKGYFAENFVAQELLAAGHKKLYAWCERNSEIEFLKSDKENIIPIEVKAGVRTQAKSLKVFMAKYKPQYVIKLSAKAPHSLQNDYLQEYPLYLSGTFC